MACACNFPFRKRSMLFFLTALNLGYAEKFMGKLDEKFKLFVKNKIIFLL